MQFALFDEHQNARCVDERWLEASHVARYYSV